MTISTLRNLENSLIEQEQKNPSSYCTLTWRRGKLIVRPVGQFLQPYLPATDNKDSLVECLEHSPINLVLIDPELGFSKVKFWADAAKTAGKFIYLSIPSIEASRQNAWEWSQIILNWVIALVILVVLSPVVLGLTILMRVYSPGTLFTREWHVGKRGKLFQIIKFRTTAINKNLLNDLDTNYTSIGRLMRKYAFDNIPQLLNVLRGEMNLLGRRSVKLEDAVKFNSEKLKQLNKAPGVTSLWQPASESKVLHHLDSQTL